MPAVWCTHSSLMILQSFCRVETNFTLTMTEENLLAASETRRVSGRGKGDVANHSMTKRSRNSCWYRTGLTTYFGRIPYNSNNSNSKKKKQNLIVIWFQTTPCRILKWAKFTPLRDCVLCGQPSQVSGWLVFTRAEQTSTPLLTHYGVHTNSGEAGKGPPVALTNMSGGDVSKKNRIIPSLCEPLVKSEHASWNYVTSLVPRACRISPFQTSSTGY